jgi:hypothetical protein
MPYAPSGSNRNIDRQKKEIIFLMDRGLNLLEQGGRDVKLTVRIHLVPWSIIVDLYLHSPTC